MSLLAANIALLFAVMDNAVGWNRRAEFWVVVSLVFTANAWGLL